MSSRSLGFLAAAAVSAALSQGALADAKPEAKKTEAAAKKCVHNCAGYSMGKGNGSNSCKGKNSCANEGLVPKECSSQKTEEGCLKVVDAKKNTMCTWL